MILKNIYKKMQTSSKFLIWGQLIFLMIIFFLENIGLPHSIIYLMDIVTMILFCCVIPKIFELKDSYFRILLIVIGGFLLYTLIGLIINRQSLFLFLWGLRNNFRSYLFMVCCAAILTTSDLKKIFTMLEIFLYANVLMSSIQFFLLGYVKDSVGGFFGNGDSCNGYMNVLLVIITIYSILRYFYSNYKIQKLIFIILCCVYISAISELKAYFFELGLIIFMAILVTHFNKKILIPILCAIVGMIVTAVLIVTIYPKYWTNFFTPSRIWDEVTRTSGYTATGDLNRLTAIHTIFHKFFDGGIQCIYGFGLGSCDYSSKFTFLMSEFYTKNQNLHYQWFSSSFIFLELGFIGLIISIGFLLMVMVHAAKTASQKYMQNEEITLCKTAEVFAVCCIFLMFYNVTLRIESSYLIFGILAIPYIIHREHQKTEKIGDDEASAI